MHGLGLSLWVGEDITAVSGETPAKKLAPGTYTLKQMVMIGKKL